MAAARLPASHSQDFREGSRAMGLAMDVDQIQAVVLTHLHGDHASGVEGLAFYFRYVLGRKLPVITHPDVAANRGANTWPAHGVVPPGRQQPPVLRSQDEFLEVIPLEENKRSSRPLQPFAAARPSTTFHHRLTIHAAGRTLGLAPTPPMTRRSSTGSPPPTSSFTKPAALYAHPL